MEILSLVSKTEVCSGNRDQGKELVVGWVRSEMEREGGEVE